MGKPKDSPRTQPWAMVRWLLLVAIALQPVGAASGGHLGLDGSQLAHDLRPGLQLKQLNQEVQALEKSEQKAAEQKQKELHALQSQIAALRPELPLKPLKSYNATGAAISASSRIAADAGMHAQHVVVYEQHLVPKSLLQAALTTLVLLAAILAAIPCLSAAALVGRRALDNSYDGIPLEGGRWVGGQWSRSSSPPASPITPAPSKLTVFVRRLCLSCCFLHCLCFLVALSHTGVHYMVSGLEFMSALTWAVASALFFRCLPSTPMPWCLRIWSYTAYLLLFSRVTHDVPIITFQQPAAVPLLLPFTRVLIVLLSAVLAFLALVNSDEASTPRGSRPDNYGKHTNHQYTAQSL